MPTYEETNKRLSEFIVEHIDDVGKIVNEFRPEIAWLATRIHFIFNNAPTSEADDNNLIGLIASAILIGIERQKERPGTEKLND